LAIEVGDQSDNNLLTALRAIWDHPFLHGCYLHSDQEPLDQERVTPDLAHIHSGVHLLGLATLSNAIQIACGTCCVREDEGVDWVGLYLPMGALSAVYPVMGFPFDDHLHQEWRSPLEDWLASIGKTVYQTAKFRSGLIGFEVSGEVSADDISINGVPQDRRIGYLVPHDGKLDYYPTTNW
jgi:hypothetical protein